MRRRSWADAGWLGLLGAISALGCEPGPLHANLLLVTLDTTRADHLGAYGYELDTSPEIDRLAQDSVVHTRAYSTTSWTLPSHASLLTGKFTASHGVRMHPKGSLVLGDAVGGAPHLRRYRANGLRPEERTLAQLLAENGFDTGAVVGGPWLKRAFGLDRGFAHYDDRRIGALRGRLGSDVSDAAIEWLGEIGDRRFFLFLNYYDPHTPYRDPEKQALRFLPSGAELPGEGQRAAPVQTRALYDGEIAYTDRQLGRVLEALRQRGLYDDTWIIVTADHGEMLGEHGRMGHGRTLFEPELRVPLIVKYPRSARRVGRESAPVQLTDVFHMILRGFGIPAPEGSWASPAGRVLAEVYPLEAHGTEGEWVVLIDGDLKLHWSSRGEHRLYDLANDPGEEQSLADSDPERLAAMQAALQAWMAGLPAPSGRGAAGQLDEETRRALRELGYLGGREPDAAAPSP
jgi:arylsulfatase A-like enzyme